MSVESIQREFQNKVSKKVRIEPEGEDRYRVLTPFQFDDRDHISPWFSNVRMARGSSRTRVPR